LRLLGAGTLELSQAQGSLPLFSGGFRANSTTGIALSEAYKLDN
jgi:hypothetical protein